MAKRSAGTYLTDQNWDEEEETEEAGSFSQASSNIIEQRQIRKAKRRNITTGESTTSGTGGVFKGFSGLTSTNAKPGFSFGGSGSKGLFGLPNGSSSASTSASSSTSLLSAQSLKGTQPGTTFSSLSSAGTEEDKSQTKDADKSSTGKTDYLQHLKTLNEGLSRWVKDHVDKNPYCILTPIFKDYEKHLANIEKKYPEKSKAKEEIKTPPTSNKEDKEATSADSSTDVTEAKPAETKKTKVPTFSFGSGTHGSSSDSGSTSLGGGTTFGGASNFGGFSFKPFTASDSSTAIKPFSMASTDTATKPMSTTIGDAAPKPFSFAINKPQTDSENGSQDEEYQPPNPEVTEVKEEGAFYTKRCKLFFKKEDSWVEKGIGNIHLKECQEKVQLIIRADTNLGNILLNVLVSNTTPLSRQGKNNVTLICVPNPPLNEKKPDDKTPVSMLIRVKTAEDADELLAKLKKD